MGQYDASQNADEVFKQLYVNEQLSREQVETRLNILRTRLQNAWGDGLNTGRNHLFAVVALIVVILTITGVLTFYGLQALESTATIATPVSLEAVPAPAGLTCDAGFPIFRDELNMLGDNNVGLHPIVADIRERYGGETGFISAVVQYNCLVLVNIWTGPETNHVLAYLWSKKTLIWTYVSEICDGPDCPAKENTDVKPD